MFDCLSKNWGILEFEKKKNHMEVTFECEIYFSILNVKESNLSLATCLYQRYFGSKFSQKRTYLLLYTHLIQIDYDHKINWI